MGYDKKQFFYILLTIASLSFILVLFYVFELVLFYRYLPIAIVVYFCFVGLRVFSKQKWFLLIPPIASLLAAIIFIDLLVFEADYFGFGLLWFFVVISFLTSVATYYFAKVFEYVLIENKEIQLVAAFRCNYDLVALTLILVFLITLMLELLRISIFFVAVMFVLSHIALLIFGAMLLLVFVVSKKRFDFLKVSLLFLLVASIIYWFIFYEKPVSTNAFYYSVIAVKGFSFFNLYLISGLRVYKGINAKRKSKEKLDSVINKELD